MAKKVSMNSSVDSKQVQCYVCIIRGVLASLPSTYCKQSFHASLTQTLALSAAPSSDSYTWFLYLHKNSLFYFEHK
jgi:hypothetical protein